MGSTGPDQRYVMPEDVQDRIEARLQRNAQTHLPFLLPYLHPGMDVLDAGCGVGNITMAPGGLRSRHEAIDPLELVEHRPWNQGNPGCQVEAIAAGYATLAGRRISHPGIDEVDAWQQTDVCRESECSCVTAPVRSC